MAVEEGGGKLPRPPIAGRVEQGILKAARGGRRGLERLANRHSGEGGGDEVVLEEPSEWTVSVAEVRSVFCRIVFCTLVIFWIRLF